MDSSAAVNLDLGGASSADRSWPSPVVPALLWLLGLALGLSQAVHGLYDETIWAPLALAVLAGLLGATAGAPRRIPLLAVLALLGLAVLSLLSSSWADSAENAWSAADRWLLYAAGLALLLWLVGGDRRRAQTLLIGVAAGVMLVALWMLLQMLRSRGASLFLGTRLNDPLGYVNGQAGYLLAGVWPFCALAERRRPALAAVGMGGVVLLVGLGALTHSRSWEFGLLCSTLLVVCVLPGRRRRIAIVLGVAVAIYLIHGWLNTASAQGVTSDVAARHAATAIGLAAVVSGLVWGAAAWVLQLPALAGSDRRRGADRLAAGGLIVLAVAAAVVLGATAGRIAHTVRDDYHAFVHLAPSPGSSRFLSGGGNRYDYWRVAWQEFRSAPIAGVGAGNYSPGYYLHRRTTESITQPHSLELQTLAELGVIGFVLLLAFVAAVGRSIFKVARAARHDLPTRYLGVAATGMFGGWLTQTSGDWEHLFPGLTLAVLGAVAVLQSRATTSGSKPLAGRPRLYSVVVAALIVGVGAVIIAPRILALSAEASARTALRQGELQSAIKDSTRALQYDGNSVSAYVLRAAAFAHFNAFRLAEADLHQALRTEPQNWTTWALLGDLLTRRGNARAAREAYRQAAKLDPLDAGPAVG